MHAAENSARAKVVVAIPMEGISFGCMTKHSTLRKYFHSLVQNRRFDLFVLFLISIQSVLLAMDNPLNDPNSSVYVGLAYLDIILTSFFLFEAMFKMISFGLVLNGQHSYLRSGWNCIDLLVVLISIVSYAFTSQKLKIVKVFRLLKVLRPLRVISRNKGLKIAIESLFMAVPSIINVIMV